jgi:antitoxin ParD1/3/4
MRMNIKLTSELEQMVREKVSSGMYTSASEVVREALRLMDEKDQLLVVKLGQLRQAVKEGIDSGPAAVWDSDDLKSAGRAKRGANFIQRSIID